MSDGPERPMLEVGRITKAHGLRGEVVVHLVSDRTERLDPGTTLHSDRGPMTVQASRRHTDRWIVSFRGSDSRESAEALRGVLLSAEALADDSEELWVHELIGARVVERDGTDRGVIESVQSNPASDLLVTSAGALIPVVFVVDGPADGLVTVEVPDGLFDL